MDGTLYVVATPIGNLQDITLRALDIFKSVDLILCEDTRMTQKLLNAYEIKAKTMSYHSHSTTAKVEKIIEELTAGKNIALVSDAGTPCISDPGVLLVGTIRDLLPEAKIVPIPGPSALISALSASGLPASEFLFLGFLPHKKGRETLFKEIASTERTVAFYESPHRILKTLESLKSHAPAKTVVIARELTKIYEEFLRGTAEELLEILTNDPQKQRGEFVVMVK